MEQEEQKHTEVSEVDKGFLQKNVSGCIFQLQEITESSA